MALQPSAVQAVVSMVCLPASFKGNEQEMLIRQYRPLAMPSASLLCLTDQVQS